MVVLRRRAAVARTERMVAEKAPLVRDALQVQWLLVRRRQWCDGDAVVAGDVRRCGGGCHGGGRRKEN
ncbi:hypothetical protein DEO72_LG11g1774 [Vigna unguiculata]|uniref:Uncharacterized protein n=1 Tax=Vigna unguiculata TaxID=3917 RepID=A0A4D6NN46_VIGUN|nr:hypothetical protein DEO72_LG11g1774 [Vigna unguiculata]